MARPYLYAATDEGQSAVDLFQRLNDPISREMIAPLPVDEGQSEVELFQRLNDPVPREMIAPLPVDEGQSEINLFQRLSDDAIPHEQFDIDSEPSDSQPFIDSLDPVLVGSDWRLAVLLAAKLDENVTLPVLDPAPGASIKAGDTIFIPCGDRVPEFGDALIYAGEDPGYVLPTGVPGLLDDQTIIMIGGLVAYMNGSVQNSFVVTSTPNLINGFDYLVSEGPGGKLPQGPAIEVSVYLEGVESFQDSYDLEIQEQLTLDISQVFVVAKDIIKLTFSSPLAVTAELQEPGTFVITPSGASPIEVLSVLPLEDKTTTVLFLQLAPKAELGADYRIAIAEGGVFSPAGDAFLAVNKTWTHHRTKTDAVVASLAGMYNPGMESTLRIILQAITMSDEEIGGDF